VGTFASCYERRGVAFIMTVLQFQNPKTMYDNNSKDDDDDETTTTFVFHPVVLYTGLQVSYLLLLF
jgi:hypothetical protein